MTLKELIDTVLGLVRRVETIEKQPSVHDGLFEAYLRQQMQQKQRQSRDPYSDPWETRLR